MLDLLWKIIKSYVINIFYFYFLIQPLPLFCIICILSPYLGITIIFTAFVVLLLWLSQTYIFLWAIRWPLHFQSYKATNKMKYVHITVAAITLTVPAIVALISYFAGGYGISNLSIYTCSARDVETTFYAVIVPIDIIIILGISQIVIIIWNIADMVSKAGN